MAIPFRSILEAKREPPAKFYYGAARDLAQSMLKNGLSRATASTSI